MVGHIGVTGDVDDPAVGGAGDQGFPHRLVRTHHHDVIGAQGPGDGAEVQVLREAIASGPGRRVISPGPTRNGTARLVETSRASRPLPWRQ